MVLVFDEIMQSTGAAWLLRFGDETAWLPKSQCKIFKDSNLITTPGWLAEKKGLEAYQEE